jgi:hypothetical protein
MSTIDKNYDIYTCETCDFKCKKNSNLQKHFTTIKHCRLTNKILNEKKCNIQDKEINSTDFDMIMIVMKILQQNKAILLENREINKLLKETILKINTL